MPDPHDFQIQFPQPLAPLGFGATRQGATRPVFIGKKLWFRSRVFKHFTLDLRQEPFFASIFWYFCQFLGQQAFGRRDSKLLKDWRKPLISSPCFILQFSDLSLFRLRMKSRALLNAIELIYKCKLTAGWFPSKPCFLGSFLASNIKL